MAFTWNTFWEKKTLSLFQDLIKSSIDVHDNLSGATSLFWVCLVYFCSWCIQPITIVRVVNLRLKWCLVYGSSPLSLFSFLTYMSAEPTAPQVNQPSFPSPFHLFTQPTAPSLVPKELLHDEWCTHLVMLCHTLKITFLHCILIFLFIKNISFSMLCVFCSFFALSSQIISIKLFSPWSNEPPGVNQTLIWRQHNVFLLWPYHTPECMPIISGPSFPKNHSSPNCHQAPIIHSPQDCFRANSLSLPLFCALHAESKLPRVALRSPDSDWQQSVYFVNSPLPILP